LYLGSKSTQHFGSTAHAFLIGQVADKPRRERAITLFLDCAVFKIFSDSRCLAPRAHDRRAHFVALSVVSEKLASENEVGGI
jgi:hypothetical protein